MMNSFNLVVGKVVSNHVILVVFIGKHLNKMSICSGVGCKNAQQNICIFAFMHSILTFSIPISCLI